MTQCNWCTLQQMKKSAAERGAEVIIKREPLQQAIDFGGDHSWWLAKYSDSDEVVMSFSVLTDGCIC